MPYTLSADVDERPVGIVGAGTLGRRLALVYAAGGSDVRIFDLSAEQREAARDYVEEHVTKTQQTLGLHPARRGRVGVSDDLQEAVAGSWMVIEAVPERIDIKTELFGDLDRLAEPDAILCSNSSSIPTSQMIAKVEHPERVLNTHYQTPPDQNAVELMSCGKTDEGVIDVLMEKIPQYGLVPFRVRRESDGFIFNRIWAAIKRECLMVVEEGSRLPRTSMPCGRSSPAPACRRFAAWTASASTWCSPSRSTTPPCATASRKAPVSCCTSTSIRGGSASRAGAASTSTRTDPGPSFT
jgi:3-hydroxybutyryl-CoA dehydrogenase